MQAVCEIILHEGISKSFPKSYLQVINSHLGTICLVAFQNNAISTQAKSKEYLTEAYFPEKKKANPQIVEPYLLLYP